MGLLHMTALIVFFLCTFYTGTINIIYVFREFDTPFFNILMQILYLSHLWLIFLSNSMIFIVLLCTLCGIIKKTDFFIGEKRYVCIYHWK